MNKSPRPKLSHMTNLQHAKKAIILLAGIVTIFLHMAMNYPTTKAFADDTGQITWGLSAPDNARGTNRSNYAYTAAPGTTINDEITITNHTNENLTLKIYAADAFTTSSGHLDLLAADEISTDMGTWVKLKNEQISIPAGSSETVPFELQIPEDAKVGDHSAGIITSMSTPASEQAVSVDQRLALRMHLRVDGELSPALKINNLKIEHSESLNPFTEGTTKITFQVTNTGNARIAGTRTLVTSTLLGTNKNVETQAFDELLPGSTIEQNFEVLGPYPWFQINSSVTINGEALGIGGGQSITTTAESTTFVFPLGAIMIILLSIIIITCLLIIWRKRRLRVNPSSTTSEYDL